MVVSGLHCPFTAVIKRNRQDRVTARFKGAFGYIMEVVEAGAGELPK